LFVFLNLFLPWNNLGSSRSLGLRTIKSSKVAWTKCMILLDVIEKLVRRKSRKFAQRP